MPVVKIDRWSPPLEEVPASGQRWKVEIRNPQMQPRGEAQRLVLLLPELELELELEQLL